MNHERNPDPMDSQAVTRGEDGVYRWMYEMDMRENRSILYTVCKILAWICLGLYVMFLVLFGMDTGFRTSTVLIITGFAVAATAALMGLSALVFLLCALIMRGKYRIRYEMGETGMEMFQSKWRKDVREARRARGRVPSMTEIVSRLSFTEVRRVKVYPKWNMIDLTLAVGTYQVYVREADFRLVLNHILSRVPEKARDSYTGM